MTPADVILYLCRSLVAWLVIVTDRPPLGVTVIYLALALAWWIGTIANPPKQSGIPLNDNGRLVYIELTK